MNSVADVWDNVLQQLKKDLSETTIATWFDELEAVDLLAVQLLGLIGTFRCHVETPPVSFPVMFP